MICKDVREIIPLYYYGEVGSDRAGAIQAHLESCADCRKELVLVGKVLEKVTAPKAPDLPNEFWIRSAADITRRVRVSRLAVPLWAAAAAAAAVVLFLFIGGRSPELQPDSTGAHAVVSVSDNVSDDVAEEAELEVELEMEHLEADIGGFWGNALAESVDKKFGGFDSGFERSLDAIEVSIEDLLMEFEGASSRGIGTNDSV